MRWLGILVAIGTVWAQTAAVPAAAPSGSSTTATSAKTTANDKPVAVKVAGRDQWVDTGVDLRAGDVIALNATGNLTLADGKSVTATGATRGWRDMIRSYPVNTAGQGALIGRVGDASEPFLIGAGMSYTSPRAGHLFLTVNKAGNDAPDGNFDVTVAFTTHAPEVTKTDYKLADITPEVVDRYPRRVVDAQGNLGDNTNYLFVGSEEKVMKALAAAGWVEVDKSDGDAVVQGILSVLNKQAYLTLPMSKLDLFDRPQDHGMAHAEPISVVATRHHFRIWKAPFQVDGQDIWVGAGTHDIGFDRDNRNNGVTHKIDPDIDQERTYVAMSLQETGLVVKEDYVMPPKPSTEAVTATGATFHSDGRILVVYLVPDAVSQPAQTVAGGAASTPATEATAAKPAAAVATPSNSPAAPAPSATETNHVPNAASESIFGPIPAAQPQP